MSTAQPPTASGNVSELPSPKAKNSLATERKRSSGVVLNTERAYVDAVACGLAWRCITPLGTPVVPELYSQNAGESSFVDATGGSDVSVNDAHACVGTAASPVGEPITTAWRSSSSAVARAPT